MTPAVLVAGCLGCIAIVLLLPIRRRSATKRLAAKQLAGGRLAAPGVPQASRPPRDLRPALSILVGTAVTLLIAHWWALPVGVAIGFAVHRGLSRWEPPAIRAERLRAAADLPLAADLLAASLRAGAPVDRAAAAVGEALGGPLGERLTQVARSLRLGGTAAEAWTHLGSVVGAERLIAAAVRSSSSGGALAGGLTRLADDLRSDRTVAAQAAAQRAGVLIVLPLGLCFLPAFLLAGLVPVVVAVLGDVL